MDTQQLESLHQEASGHYLKGDLAAARQAWTRLLELAPGDERALEGIRLCEQLAGGEESSVCTAGHSPFAVSEETPAAQPPPEDPVDLLDLPDEIDMKLAFGEPEPATADESDEVGFLDLSGLADEVDGMETTARPAAPAPIPAPTPAPPAPAVDPPPVVPTDAFADGASGAAGEPISEQDAAAMELRRRVNELLANALVFMEQDRKEEALKTLDRLLILDEENEAAWSLKTKIEDELGLGGDATDDFGSDEPKLQQFGAEPVPREGDVFDPGDVPALDLDLEPPEMAEEPDVSLDPGTDFDPDAGFDPDAEFDPDAGYDPDAEFNDPEDVEAPGAVRATPPATELAPPQKANFLLIGVVAVVVLAALAYFLLPRFMGGGVGPTGDPALEAAAAVDAALEPLQVPDGALNNGSENAGPAEEPSLEQEIAAAVGEGEQAMESGDYSLAVIAFGRALELRPDSQEIRRQLTKAGDLYRDRQEVERQWTEARDLFEQGSYKQSLRILYRLPDTEDQAKILRYQINGWYNLGVQALKSADCEAAVENFGEARNLSPRDDEIASGQTLAASCDGQRSTAYLIKVDALTPRAIDD